MEGEPAQVPWPGSSPAWGSLVIALRSDVLQEVVGRSTRGWECRLRVTPGRPARAALTVPAGTAHCMSSSAGLPVTSTCQTLRRLATSYGGVGAGRRSSRRDSGIACATTGSCSPQRRRSTPRRSPSRMPGHRPGVPPTTSLALLRNCDSLAGEGLTPGTVRHQRGEPCASGAVACTTSCSPYAWPMKVHERHSCRSEVTTLHPVSARLGVGLVHAEDVALGVEVVALPGHAGRATLGAPPDRQLP